MTLAEQLVVVALVGGLGCWGLAIGQEKRQRHKVEAVAGDLLAGIQLARAEAERDALRRRLADFEHDARGQTPASATPESGS
jgi:Tfp pilus assembly protein FimT